MPSLQKKTKKKRMLIRHQTKALTGAKFNLYDLFKFLFFFVVEKKNITTQKVKMERKQGHQLG